MLRKAFTKLFGATSDFWLDKTTKNVYSYDNLEKVLIRELDGWSLRTIALHGDLVPVAKQIVSFDALDVLIYAIRGMEKEGELVAMEQTLYDIRELTEEDLKELQTALDNLKIAAYKKKA